MTKICIVKQHDLQDCGIASLCSIIEYYDGFVPMERLRIDTHTTKDGTTAYHLLNAAKKYGFEVKGVKITSLDDKNIFLPAIAHMKYKNGLNHFVVVYSITKTKVTIMDPARGKVVCKRSEFNEDFSKILLMFYPKEKILFMEKGKSILQVFFDILKNQKRIFAFIIGISILLTATTIIASYYFKISLEAIGENTYLEYIKLIIFTFLIITIFKCLFTYIRSYLENHLNKNIDCLLISNFLNHLFKIPSNSIISRSNAEVISRVNELNNLKSLYTEIFINFLLDFILMLASMPILLFISSKMFLVLFFLILLYLIVGLISSKNIYTKAYQNISYQEEFNNYLLESIKAYSSIKNLNITPFILKNIEEKTANYIYDSYKLNDYVLKNENIKNCLNEIGFYLVNTIGIILIMHNKLSIPNLITFNSIMTYFLNPIKNLIDTIPKFNFFKATYTKITDFINIPTEKLGKRQDFKKNDITVNALKFSYNDFHDTLKDVSFKIKAGEKIMFKGNSGCGKSTMCKILIKEFNNYEGTVLIGDKNLQDYSLKTIRENILYVSQNENLFTDTLRENLTLGRIISEEKLNEMVKICMLDKIIDKKPFRYETFINNATTTISGGEKQRIILARSLIKDAKILILDEVLSEVDYETERQIITNIKNYFHNKTIIYITHKKQDDLFDKVITFKEVV